MALLFKSLSQILDHVENFRPRTIFFCIDNIKWNTNFAYRKLFNFIIYSQTLFRSSITYSKLLKSVGVFEFSPLCAIQFWTWFLEVCEWVVWSGSILFAIQITKEFKQKRELVTGRKRVKIILSVSIIYMNLLTFCYIFQVLRFEFMKVRIWGILGFHHSCTQDKDIWYFILG